MAVAYPEERKTEALALYCEVGANETVRRTGIARRTIHRWVKDADLGAVPYEKLAAAHEAAEIAWTARKAVEALEAGTDAAAVREAMVGYVMEDRTLDAMRLVSVYGVLIDKAQLLSGAPTSREGREFDWDGEMARLREDLATKPG